MRWLLDSNVVIDALVGLPHGTRVLREAHSRPGVLVVFSAVTRLEVLGFPKLDPKEEAAIRTLLNEFEEIPISNAVIEQALIRRSVRIKIPDALIAASAQIAQAIVVTRNTGDFQSVNGLTVVHPDDV